VQTVFTGALCIEWTERRHLPMTASLHRQREEKDLRGRLMGAAINRRGLYRQRPHDWRIMAKDEDVCLHCGLCAERCPTGAWTCGKYYMEMTNAEAGMPQALRR